MDTAKFAVLRRLFSRVLDEEPADRERMAAELCGDDQELARELVALVRADSDPSPGPVMIDTEPGATLSLVDPIGQSIAGFRIVRRIGSGGMGAVYEAVQTRPHRCVALKTLAVGLSSERAKRRFEDEAEILARLRHPGIAQVFEAGTWRVGSGEIPWYAMELVEGAKPVDRYVREAGLDARGIAVLVRDIGVAVEFAHRRGVIHRDLKPANVLIDRDGAAKVIDFGIARIVDTVELARQTRTGELLGTLAYMSPERLDGTESGAVTTADVYALGVILYELLAGRRPFDVDALPPSRALDVLLHTEPPALSRVAHDRAVPVELDWIVQRAMHRDPDRRYSTAASFVADLERFLAGQAVDAGPPSASHRLRVLMRRHRLAIGAAGVVLGAALVGAVVAAVGWARTAQAERSARREAVTLDEVNRFQQRILGGVYSSARGREVRLADLIDGAVADLDRESLSDPEVEVGLRVSMGISYMGLGLHDVAVREFDKANALIASAGIDPKGGRALAVRNNLGLSYGNLGRLTEAEVELRASLAGRLALYGADHEETAIARHNLSEVLHKLGNGAEALEQARAALDTFVRMEGEGSREAITARTSMALALASLGRIEQADATYERAYELARSELEPDHPARLATVNSYAAWLGKRGRNEEAVRLTGEVAEARTRVLGPSHPDTLIALNNLAVGQLNLGRAVDAETTLRRLIALRTVAGTVGGYDVIVTAQNLTSVVRRQGRLTEAEGMARELLDQARAELPADHWLIGIIGKELGTCLREAGRLDEAEPLLLGAHAALEAGFGATDGRVQKAVDELVALYEAMQRPDEAAKWRGRSRPAKGG